jgi:hypothetical protein
MQGELMDSDRFGTPESAFEAAQRSHGLNNPATRMGMYIPTREEVGSMPAGALSAVIDLWLWESPTELIPTPRQIVEVRSVLIARSDAQTPAIMQIVADCDHFLETSR